MSDGRASSESEKDEDGPVEERPKDDGPTDLPSPTDLKKKAEEPRDLPPVPPRQDFVSKIPKYPPSVPAPPADLDPYQPKVDKYFGTKLPPVCRKLGCYVTDNGKFFYCVNPNCHKDRRRETKYNRRRKSFVYFFCPKCRSREIQLHLRKNQYECMECAYNWRK